MQQSDKATWVCAILFPFVMILLFANALIFDPTTYKAFLTPEAVPATLQLVGWFRDKAPMPQVFDASEQSHLLDVKQLIVQLQYVLFILLVVFFSLLLFADVAKVMTLGFIFLLCLVFIIALVPFDTIFAHFHMLSFASNSWIFPQESTLITFYPFSFFQTFFQHIVIITTLFSAILGLFGALQRKPL